MKNRPVKVSLIGKENDNVYQIKFPKLNIPVNVNEELYKKMLRSPQYQFDNFRKDKREKHFA